MDGIETKKQELEDLILEIKETYKAKGIAVAAVDREGNTLYEQTFGYRNEEEQLPINEDTIFGLASISKSFTAICILQLVNAGVISLEDPVSNYLPYYSGIVKGQPVKIRHFLSHSGGYFPLKRTCIGPVAAILSDVDSKEDLSQREDIAETGARIVARQMEEQKVPLGSPGEYMSYCNDGFGLLSEIIRLKGGEKSFADYVKKKVLLPLGMNRSNAEFRINTADSNAAILYSKEGEKSIADLDYTRLAFVLGGGGALKSTIRDFKRYLALYLGEEKPDLLPQAWIREMMIPRVYHQPGCSYGYGLFLKDFKNTPLCFHNGSLPGVSSYFGICPDAGLGVVVLCNTEDVPVDPIGEAVLSVLLGGSAAVSKDRIVPIEWSREQIEDAAGFYQTDEGSEFSLISEKDSILMEQDGQRVCLIPVAGRRLLKEGRYKDTPIDLFTDEKGMIFAAKYGGRVYPKK